jgi:hypothetical protein
MVLLFDPYGIERNDIALNISKRHDAKLEKMIWERLLDYGRLEW